MQNLLKKHFGYTEFRPLQKEAIENVLVKKDTFVLMPTGGGKSLCYQLPALKLEGITLVISPLIALMKDQVDALLANGINAAFLNSSLTGLEIKQIENQLRAGEIKILYVAPERLALPHFQEFLHTLKIDLIAIDEAHCISEWGHDFRPDYRNLRLLKTTFPEVPLIALTATATEKVRADILQQLHLDTPKQFVSSFNRENLSFSVLPKRNTFDHLVHLLKKQRNESVIIYCFSRKETDGIAASLKQEGFKAAPYHAGLSNDERKQNQELFVKDKIDIIVATIAFGMGIDKPDVRMVVHHSLPKTIEGYYQEVGRAGRDGLPSECILFYSYADKRKHDFFIDQTADEKQANYLREKLQQVIDYGETKRCRRKYLLNYFGEEYLEDNCQSCDACLSKEEMIDATEVAQKILSCVIRTGNCFGKNYVIDVLKGRRAKKILQNNHDELTVHGIVQDFSADNLKDFFQSLVDLNFIKKDTGKFPTFYVTEQGREFLQTNAQIKLPKPQEEFVATVVKKSRQALDYNVVLFEKMRFLRKQLADKKNVPPFVIFGDQSLQEMAYYLPTKLTEFANITGVGTRKLDEYGNVFINLIKEEVHANSLTSVKVPTSRVRTQKRAKVSNGSRYLQTKKMVEKKESLLAIAKAQSFTESTIIGHIEKLLLAGETFDYEYLRPSQDTYDAISFAFTKFDDAKLKPVYEYLEEQYSYNQIRLVKFFMEH